MLPMFIGTVAIDTGNTATTAIERNPLWLRTDMLELSSNFTRQNE